ncbi:hypothetical protein ACOMHN_061673 [Nucella lapillus]
MAEQQEPDPPPQSVEEGGAQDSGENVSDEYVDLDDLEEFSEASPPLNIPETKPSIPHLPVTDHKDTGQEGTMTTSALNVVWSYGVNPKVAVLNLTDKRRKAVMYACSHVGVIYDYENNKQYILQGHLNCITCSCLSEDKRWLITGDKGPDAVIIAWDTYTGIPIQTMYDPNPDGGFVVMALSSNGSILATISAAGPDQLLAVWNWTVDGEKPLCSVELALDSCGVQHHLMFCGQDYHFLVSTGRRQVVFLRWDEKSIEYFAPSLTESGFSKLAGYFTQSSFINDTTEVVSGTTSGYLVLWDNNGKLSTDDGELCQSADKQALKISNVHRGRGIDVVTLWDKYVVVGDQGGQVTIMDKNLTLIHWYQLGLGAITAVSFAKDPDVSATLQAHTSNKMRKKVRKSVVKLDPAFVVRDFVVASSDSVIASVTRNGDSVKIIQREHNSAVHAISLHPSQPYLAMGSYSNLLKVWNYETKEVLVSRCFDQNGSFHTCAYDPKGYYIAVGQTNGAVRVLDSLTLHEETAKPIHVAKSPITRIVFSPDSAFMATSDADHTTSLFRAQDCKEGGPYKLLARYRAHSKPICDLMFCPQPSGNVKLRLLSLGADRHMVEYDLEKSEKGNLVVQSWDRIEQSAVPCCMTCYPPLSKEDFIITANDQFKLKLYNKVTKMCRKTLLGPTYGSPLKKLLVVPKQGKEDRYYGAYATEDKVGLVIMPVTGNPHNTMAMVAHPFGVSRLEVSHDGRYLFTAGGVDLTVHMWEINFTALEAQAKLGGGGLIPFYGLLEGGREGAFFNKLEDYFYYTLLRSQGLDAVDKREVSTTIQVSQLPFLMRALCLYPTEQEMEEMLNEVRFSRYADTGEMVTEVDLGTIIKLYVNHRPAFGYTFDKLQWAFDTLGVPSPAGGTLPCGELLDLLQNRGPLLSQKM